MGEYLASNQARSKTERGDQMRPEESHTLALATRKAYDLMSGPYPKDPERMGGGLAELLIVEAALCRDAERGAVAATRKRVDELEDVLEAHAPNHPILEQKGD